MIGEKLAQILISIALPCQFQISLLSQIFTSSLMRTSNPFIDDKFFICKTIITIEFTYDRSRGMLNE